MLYLSTSVGLGYGLFAGAISWKFFAAWINPIRPDNLRPSSPPAGRGILTSFPSTTTFVLALGAGSPCVDYPCAGTLGLSAGLSLTGLYVTHVSILTSDISRSPHGISLHRLTERSATALDLRPKPASSVYSLSPVTFSAQASLTRPVSYYAFFKRWLLLSQLPGCLGLPTSFST